MKSNTLLPALLLGIAIVAAGWFIGSGIENFKRLDHKVTVKGLSEREVPANKVTWPLIYKELGNDPSAMYELIEQKNRVVVSFLKISMSVLKRTFMRSKPFFLAVDLASM